jgi:hypothetical protein
MQQCSMPCFLTYPFVGGELEELLARRLELLLLPVHGLLLLLELLGGDGCHVPALVKGRVQCE